MSAVGTKQPDPRAQDDVASLPVWTDREPSGLRYVAPLIIFIAALVAYSGNLRAAYHFDDLATLQGNAALTKLRAEYELNTREGDSPIRRFRAFRKALGPALESLYEYNPFRVVAYGSFALNDFFSDGLRGDYLEGDPYTVRPKAAVHRTNNIIHALNGALVFWLVYLTLTAPAYRESSSAVRFPALVALLAGLIFALHPMQTQAVTYLSQRAESLCATFYLLTLCLVVSARLRSLGEGRGSAPWMTTCLLGGLGLALGVAALLAKRSDASFGAIVKLAGVLALLGFGGVIALVKTGRDEAGHGALALGAFLSFALALQTKEVAATIPIAVVLWDLLFVPRGEPGAPSARARLWPVAALRAGGLARVRYMAPWLVVVALVPIGLLLWGGKVVQQQMFEPVTVGGWMSKTMTPADYVLSQGNVLHTYARSFVLPTNLHLDHDYPTAPLAGAGAALTTLLSFAGLLAAVLLALLFGARARAASFGLLFGLAVLAPSSSVIVLTDVIYEHRFYLPLAGAALVAAVVVERLLRRAVSPGQTQQALMGLCALAAIGLGLATASRNDVWDSDMSLWTDNTAKAPGKPRSWTNLGLAYQNREESRVELRGGQVLRAQTTELPGGAVLIRRTANLSGPPQPVNKSDIVEITPMQGGLEKAREHYHKALALDPKYNKAQNNLALISVYERHNLVLENQFIRTTYVPMLAKRNLTALGEPIRRRLQNNHARIEALTQQALEIFQAQDRAGISNYFLWNNLANLYFQHGLFLASAGDYERAVGYARNATERIGFARNSPDVPVDVWALSGEMHKFRGDVTFLALEKGALAERDLPEAWRPPAQWKEALLHYNEYIKRSSDRKHFKRIRSAAEETLEYLQGKRKPSTEAPANRSQIRRPDGSPVPPEKEHDHPPRK